MPRPGPRPYECVRRSWHSNRHHPIRGSIIQQIFRIVHENHSTGTKKNREWQEKLPLVVLKSEEIMYSKANSEAEYLDPETLWDRVNDAINIIIRKDETMETGEFLPPCVEAALNLGCVAVRTSRSQRNSNTRSYLSPRNQDHSVTSPKTIDTTTNTRALNLPNHERPSVSSIYRLYYGVHFRPQNPRPLSHTTHQNSNTIIVGTPVFQTVHGPLRAPLMNFSEMSFLFNGSKKTVHEEPQPPLVECDLSLRLGLVSSRGKGLTRVNDVDSGQNKEFTFFPLSSEGELVKNLVADVRKLKAVLVNNNVVDGEHRLLQLEPDFNQKRRGL